MTPTPTTEPTPPLPDEFPTLPRCRAVDTPGGAHSCVKVESHDDPAMPLGRNHLCWCGYAWPKAAS